MTTPQRTALVTGASSGIGEVFARRLARDGYRLILVARRRDRLDQLARELPGADTLAADLTLPHDVALVEARIAAEPALELLINNAGFGTKGLYWETDFAAQEKMHLLHIMTTMRLTRAALAAMVPRARGGVINVSSVAGFGTTPNNVSYCSTKAWMNRFTEGLDLELRGAGSPVRVQALCPGFTVTEFQDTMGLSRDNIPSWMWMRAEDVVDESLRGLAEGRLFVVPGAFYKFLVALEKVIPRRLRAAALIAAARRRGVGQASRPVPPGEASI